MENNTNFPNQLPMQEVYRFAASPAGQKLIELMQQQGGSEFQKAMERAAAGDYAQAKQAIEALMADPQAQKLLKEFGR